MKKYLIVILAALGVLSCSTDEDRPSLLIPEKDAQVAELVFAPDETLSPFYYLIQAGEIVVNWGDNSRPKEYVYLGDWTDLVNIKPIEYTYQNKGNYSVNIRTSNPISFDFSRSIDGRSPENRISNLNLHNCISLKKLFCKNQPISSIYLSECTELTVADFSGSEIQTIEINKKNKITTFCIDSTFVPSFDCSSVLDVEELGIGSSDKQQAISNINQLKKLRKLIVKGDINLLALDMTRNDSIHSVKGVNTNIRDLNLSGLNRLDSISLEKCTDLNRVQLKANNALKHIVLRNNPALDAGALNAIFMALPQVTGTDKTIVLAGNLGDATCNRSIATSKGWSFRSDL